MTARNRLAYDSGNRLISAGLGLSVIADLLGADGSEHYLEPAQLDRLAHAVSAIAELVKRDGYDLTEAFDPDELPAPQRAAEDLGRALAATGKPAAQRKGGAQ